MNKRNKKKICENLDILVERINMKKLLPELYKRNVLKEFDQDIGDISQMNLDDSETKKKIITAITNKKRAYKKFIDSLNETEQTDLVNILENKLKNPNNNTIVKRRKRRLAEFTFDPSTAENPLKIRVRKSRKFKELGINGSQNELYNMTSNPRGLALILTLIDYHGSLEKRSSAKYDAVNVKKLLQEIGYQVYEKRNLTTKQINEFFKEFSQNKKFAEVDSCIVVISGHGDWCQKENDCVVQGIDNLGNNLSGCDKEVTYSKILSYFTSENCPLLRNKPKIFIFQLCRGKIESNSVAIPNHNITMRYARNHNMTVNTENGPMPNYTDIVFAHSTVPGHVSYRNPKTGSWYLQVLCEVFMKCAHNTEVVSLLRLVNKRLKKIVDSQNKCQTSNPELLGFDDKCYLNPGIFSD